MCIQIMLALPFSGEQPSGFGIPVGRSSPTAGKKRRANDSAKQTRNKNPALFGAKPITVFFSFLCCFP